MTDKHAETVEIASTSRVLDAEFRLIWGDAPHSPGPTAIGDLAFARGQTALCLSGGGLGSSAFALGVLQALSRRRLLTGFHYLSTVSGGGYVGGWLQRWMHSELGAERVMMKLGALGEPPQVSALRPGSPSSDSPAGDRWHTAALVLRNATIYWLMLGPALLLLALIPNLFLEFVAWSHGAITRIRWLNSGYLAVAGMAIALAVYWSLRLLPSYRGPAGNGRVLEGSPSSRVIAPMLCWALMAIPATSIYAAEFSEEIQPALPELGLLIATVAGMAVGLLAALMRLPPNGRRALLHDTPVWIVSFAATAGLVLAQMRLVAAYHPDPFGFGMRIIAGFGMLTGLFDIGEEFTGSVSLIPGQLPHSSTLYLLEASFVVLGPLSLMLAQLLGGYVFIAFRTAGQLAQPDADREWMARLSAAQLKVMLLWGFVGFAALLLSTGINRYAPVIDLPDVVFIAISSCVIALIASDQSDQATWSGILGIIVRFIPLRFISAVATFVFAVSLILAANQFTGILWRPLAKKMADWGPPLIAPHIVAGLVLAMHFALAAWFVGSRVAMNRFSFTELHRDRLTRMFLGGVNAARDPDPFTDFDPSDNVRLRSLVATSHGRAVLYPVYNASMEVANRQSEERACESFIFTPCYSGASALAWRESPDEEAKGAFVSTSIYADDEMNLGMEGSGVTLASAMAISGAGAGVVGSRGTSSSLRFIMSLLNLGSTTRLPNPARAETLGYEVMRSWPSTSLGSLLRDLAGTTRRDELDIRVGDGGRFDSLGLYEMIRRRCCYILAIDATIDPELSFAALGNAMRKVKIDFGVDIRFRGPDETRTADPAGKARRAAWATARIVYPDGSEGKLLYLKATVLGSDLPVDVASYAAGNRLFPHEVTSGFSITEAQFESHRRLGESLLSGIGLKSDSGFVADWFAEAELQAAGEGEIVNLLYEAVERSKDAGSASARSQ